MLCSYLQSIQAFFVAALEGLTFEVENPIIRMAKIDSCAQGCPTQPLSPEAQALHIYGFNDADLRQTVTLFP